MSRKGHMLCQKCGKPVILNAANYETFERMHWVCFHLEYEHGTFDPDQPCDDPSCFWKHHETP